MLTFLQGMYNMAKRVAQLCLTIITARENLLVATSPRPMCVIMDKERVCPSICGLWMFTKRLIKDSGVFRSHRMYVKFACFSDSLYMKGDTW